MTMNYVKTQESYTKLDNQQALRISSGNSVQKFGTWDLHFYQIKQIKRVRIVKRSDGYYVQFCVDAQRGIDTTPTGKTVGLDAGLHSFYTDSQGNKVDNPRYLRKSEKSLKRLQKRVSRKKKVLTIAKKLLTVLVENTCKYHVNVKTLL